MKHTKSGMIDPTGVHFYYVYHGGHPGQRKPIGCVCFGQFPNSLAKVPVWCRGISICSKSDNFSRREARRIAYARFQKAVGTRETADQIVIVTSSEHATTLSCFRGNAGFGWKTAWDCRLTDKENKIAGIEFGHQKGDDQ